VYEPFETDSCIGPRKDRCNGRFFGFFVLAGGVLRHYDA